MKKGIIVELTALLDVIFIMLFWVMMNFKQSTESIKQESQEKVIQAESEVQLIEDKLVQAEQDAENAREELLKAQESEKNALAELDEIRSEMDKVKTEADKEVAEAWATARNIDQSAVENLLALQNYEQGLLLVIDLNYSQTGEIHISCNGSELNSLYTSESQEQISEAIQYSLYNIGVSPENTVLCAFSYHGGTALYRDVKKVKQAIQDVKSIYSSFYCTYINQS